MLDTPAILVPDAQERWRATSQTFGEVYAETPMERADVEHALSMFFNDVRLKTYVEIRPADAMPVKYAVAYAALIKGIFYSEHNLQSYLDAFATVTESDVADAKAALMQDGWNAEVYGRPVRELLEQVVTSAKLALSEEDRTFLEPLAALAFKGVSLAELTALEEK